MIIVTMPWWAWLIYLPARIALHISVFGALLTMRCTSYAVRRAAASRHTHRA